MPLPPVPTFHPIANPDAVVTAKNVRFTVLTDRLVRLESSKGGHFEDRPSQAFWYRDQPVPTFSTSVTEELIEIETDYLHLKYQITARGFTAETLSITLKESGVTWQYGMKQTDNLGGTARTLDGRAGTIKLLWGALPLKSAVFPVLPEENYGNRSL